MKEPEISESLLTRLCAPESDEAWFEFYRIYQPLIYRLAQAKGVQHADAEDLSQDVLMAIRRSIGSFNPNAGSFRCWLYRITRNLVFNHLTRVRNPIGSGDSDVHFLLMEKTMADAQESTSFQLEYRRHCFQQVAYKMKSKFHDSTWRAFWLTAVEQRSIKSVANELGKSVAAVRIARCRVFARLRNEVSKDLNHEF